MKNSCLEVATLLQAKIELASICGSYNPSLSDSLATVVHEVSISPSPLFFKPPVTGGNKNLAQNGKVFGCVKGVKIPVKFSASLISRKSCQI